VAFIKNKVDLAKNRPKNMVPKIKTGLLAVLKYKKIEIVLRLEKSFIAKRRQNLSRKIRNEVFQDDFLLYLQTCIKTNKKKIT
jgi:hypothetical protein